jgi:hypothetical protein
MADAIPDKTEAGRLELRTRAQGLPPRLRSVLILVDGVRGRSELQQAMAGIGAPPDALDTLAALGLIAAAPAPPPAPVEAAEVVPDDSEPEPFDAAPTYDPERFRVTKKFMNDTIVDALGLRAFMFTLKLEKCATLADLALLAPEYSRLVLKARGSEVAHALRNRLRVLLR